MLNITKRSLHEIQADGGKILQTDLFQEAARTDHHYGYTIANHEIHVCIIALLLVTILSFIGLHFHVKELVRGIMCHDLTPIETDVIVKHMFPLCKTGIPFYRETWVITIADKWCAMTEGLHLSRKNWIAKVVSVPGLI